MISISKIVASIKELVYPRDLYCAGCSVELFNENISFCNVCLDKVDTVDGKSYIDGVSKVNFSAHYNDFVKDLIHKYKYSYNSYIARAMSECFNGDCSCDIIVAVPMHPNRKKLRGFSHIDVLCKEVERQISLEYSKQALTRVVDTVSQATLSGDERRTNLINAFSSNVELVSGKKILLIDDVITTGSTIRECTKTLIDAGASSVSSWAFAH